MSDQFVAVTSTREYTTLTADKHQCPRRDSNPQFQAGEQAQTYALDSAATGTGSLRYLIRLTDSVFKHRALRFLLAEFGFCCS
jgi:hypothetical protein